MSYPAPDRKSVGHMYREGETLHSYLAESKISVPDTCCGLTIYAIRSRNDALLLIEDKLSFRGGGAIYIWINGPCFKIVPELASATPHDPTHVQDSAMPATPSPA